MSVSVFRRIAAGFMVCSGSVLTVTAVFAESRADYDYFSEITTISPGKSDATAAPEGSAVSLDAADESSLTPMLELLSVPARRPSQSRGSRLSLPDAPVATEEERPSAPPVRTETVAAQPARTETASRRPASSGTGSSVVDDEIARVVNAVASEPQHGIAAPVATVTAPATSIDTTPPSNTRSVPSGDVAGLLDSLSLDRDNEQTQTSRPGRFGGNDSEQPRVSFTDAEPAAPHDHAPANLGSLIDSMSHSDAPRKGAAGDDLGAIVDAAAGRQAPASAAAPRDEVPGDIGGLIDSMSRSDSPRRKSVDDIGSIVDAVAGSQAPPSAVDDIGAVIDAMSRQQGAQREPVRSRDVPADDIGASAALIDTPGRDRPAAEDTALIDRIAAERAAAEARARSTMQSMFGDMPAASVPGARVLTRSSDDLELGRLVDAVGAEGKTSHNTAAVLEDNARSLLGLTTPAVAEPEPVSRPQVDFSGNDDVAGVVADLIGEQATRTPSADEAIRAIVGRDKTQRRNQSPDRAAESVADVAIPQRVPASGARVDEDPVVVVTAIKPLPTNPISPQQSKEETRRQIMEALTPPPGYEPEPEPVAPVAKKTEPAPMVREVDDAALAALLGMESGQDIAPQRAPHSGGVVDRQARPADPVTRAPAREIQSRDERPRTARSEAAAGGYVDDIGEIVALVGNDGGSASGDFASRSVPTRRSEPARSVAPAMAITERAPAAPAPARERAPTLDRSQSDDLIASLTSNSVSRRSVEPPPSRSIAPGAAPSRRAPSRSVPPPNAGIYVFGPTKPGTRLEEIADILIPADNITIEQMMWALYVKNPNAFHRGNISRLKDFYILNVPHVEEIREVSDEVARASLARLRGDTRASR